VNALDQRNAALPGRGPGLRPVLWLVAAALLVVACSDTRPYVAAVDALPLPATWEVVKTDVGLGISFCVNCPHVSRYYLASGDMPAVLKQIEQAIREAGYTDVQTSDPACDRNGNGALCSITARNGRFLLIAAVYRPGDDVDHLGLSRAGIPMVRITAQAA
jgi:hypothetical protein